MNTQQTTGQSTASKVMNAVKGAAHAITGNTHGQAPLGTQHAGTSNQPVHSTHVSEVSRETFVAPTVEVQKVEKPVIVKETILPKEKIEVQPVIHREREQLEVHEVIQPMRERDIAATQVKHATLAAEIRPEMRESDTAFQNTYREATTRHVPEFRTEAVQREFVNKPAIVEERVHKKIVEEIQPVLYKETIVPVIIEETQPIYEKVVEAPRIVEEIKPMVDLGTRYTEMPATQMGNLSLGGQPQMSSFPVGGQPQMNSFPVTGQSVFPHKETTITQESWVEPGKRDGLPLAGQHQSSHPHTQTKRII